MKGLPCLSCSWSAYFIWNKNVRKQDFDAAILMKIISLFWAFSQSWDIYLKFDAVSQFLKDSLWEFASRYDVSVSAASFFCEFVGSFDHFHAQTLSSAMEIYLYFKIHPLLIRTLGDIPCFSSDTHQMSEINSLAIFCFWKAEDVIFAQWIGIPNLLQSCLLPQFFWDRNKLRHVSCEKFRVYYFCY